jgi:hypothetical protein
MNTPSIAMLVRVAKMPPAGVNPPYAQLWNHAAMDPTEREYPIVSLGL